VATPALIQTDNNSNFGSTTNAVTMSGSQTAGDTNIVLVLTGGGETVTTVTDLSGNSYVFAGGRASSNPGGVDDSRIEIWWSKSIASAIAGVNVVTTTISAADNTDVFVLEFSNLGSTAVTNGSGGGSNTTGTAITSSSITPTNAVSVTIGYVNASGGGFVSAGGSFSQANGSSLFGNAAIYRILTSATTVTPSATQSSSGAWDIFAVTFAQPGAAKIFDVIAFGAEA
jgi:hypothetical protein